MLDKITRANAMDTLRICQQSDWDNLVTLDGGERTGKSSVGMDLTLLWEPEIERDIQCEIYDSFMSRYAWDWGEWYDLLKSSNKRVVVREEADMLGRESMTVINRRILRILSTVGRRNNEMILMFPDFWRLDLYARIRTRIRGYVYARVYDEEKEPIRGYVIWYVRIRYPFPRDGSTVWWMRAYTGRFDHISRTSPEHAEAWARFREREQIAKDRVLESSDTDVRRTIAVRLHAKGLTVRDIASLMDSSKSSVGEWVKQGLVVANNTSTMGTEKDIPSDVLEDTDEPEPEG